MYVVVGPPQERLLEEWSAKELLVLVQAVQKYGMDNWAAVCQAFHIPSTIEDDLRESIFYTPEECEARFKEMLNGNIVENITQHRSLPKRNFGNKVDHLAYVLRVERMYQLVDSLTSCEEVIKSIQDEVSAIRSGSKDENLEEIMRNTENSLRIPYFGRRWIGAENGEEENDPNSHSKDEDIQHSDQDTHMTEKQDDPTSGNSAVSSQEQSSKFLQVADLSSQDVDRDAVKMEDKDLSSQNSMSQEPAIKSPGDMFSEANTTSAANPAKNAEVDDQSQKPSQESSADDDAHSSNKHLSSIETPLLDPQTSSPSILHSDHDAPLSQPLLTSQETPASSENACVQDTSVDRPESDEKDIKMETLAAKSTNETTAQGPLLQIDSMADNPGHESLPNLNSQSPSKPAPLLMTDKEPTLTADQQKTGHTEDPASAISSSHPESSAHLGDPATLSNEDQLTRSTSHATTFSATKDDPPTADSLQIATAQASESPSDPESQNLHVLRQSNTSTDDLATSDLVQQSPACELNASDVTIKQETGLCDSSDMQKFTSDDHMVTPGSGSSQPHTPYQSTQEGSEQSRVFKESEDVLVNAAGEPLEFIAQKNLVRDLGLKSMSPKDRYSRITRLQEISASPLVPAVVGDSEETRLLRTKTSNMLRIWNVIYKHKYSRIFHEPVTAKEAPDYRELIKQPMDLSTIRNRLDDGYYKSYRLFYRDMLLIFANCICYNQKGSDLYDIAMILKVVLQKEIDVYLEQESKAEATSQKPVTPTPLQKPVETAKRRLSDSTMDRPLKDLLGLRSISHATPDPHAATNTLASSATSSFAGLSASDAKPTAKRPLDSSDSPASTPSVSTRTRPRLGEK